MSLDQLGEMSTHLEGEVRRVATMVRDGKTPTGEEIDRARECSKSASR